MFAKLPIDDFLAKTAAATAVPGGGTVAALSAAAAAGLVEMVANLTIGKKACAAVADIMREIAISARILREKLLQEMDRDADAYTQVLEALRLPKTTAGEREIRSAAVQEAFKTATRLPLEVAKNALEIMELAGTVIARGAPNAATDGLVAAMVARTAGLAALQNVRSNLVSIDDEAFLRELYEQVLTLDSGLTGKEQSLLASFDL